MRTLIFQCKTCKSFTTLDMCNKCNIPTINPLPPRYSPQDKYGKYRRMLRKE
ncbi:MAG: nucleolar RNA-binding Nop10p family protein [archaeon]|nr:nucleolar RNA-binding Nop10p family protein [archaeon]